MQLEFTLPNGMELVLKTPTADDVERLYEAAITSRDELAPWMPWCHEEYRSADTESWIQQTVAAENEHSFIIVDEASQLCLGTCGLNDINPRHRCANLGYWVRSSHNGQGIASSATLRVAAFAFDELQLVRVEIVAALGNHASQRVAEKVCATREGVIRNGLVHGESAHDAVLNSLIPSDFQGG